MTIACCEGKKKRATAFTAYLSASEKRKKETTASSLARGRRERGKKWRLKQLLEKKVTTTAQSLYLYGVEYRKEKEPSAVTIPKYPGEERTGN